MSDSKQTLTRWRLDRAEEAVVAAITKGDSGLYPMAAVLVRHLRECVAEDCGTILTTLRHEK